MFSTPILMYAIIALICFLSFGILWPSGTNKGSLSSSNSEYAAISFSSLFMLIGVIGILFFSGIISAIAEWKYEHHEEEDELNPPYFFSDPLEHPDLTIEQQNAATFFKQSEQVTVLECNSLNSLYDRSDSFVYDSWNQSSENYHVMIKSTQELELYSVRWEGSKIFFDIDLSDFNTSELQYNLGASEEFSLQLLGIDESSEYEELSYAKYNIAYISVSNSSEIDTSAILTAAIEDAGTPSKCETFSLTGSLESRVRATSLGFLFAGTFLIGCCIHRFYIVSGNHGRTSQRTMTRAFLISQAISYSMFSFMILIFDPLDGYGVTGVSTVQLVEAGILMAKITAAACGLLVVSILSLVLYRQRHLIGEMIEVEQTRGDVDGWFD